MNHRGGIVGIACIAVVVALAACTPSSGAISNPTPRTAASSTPTPDPIKESPQAATIMVSSSTMQVLDEDGALLKEFSYFEAVDQVAAELSTVLGIEPTIEPFHGGGDVPPGTNYDWGAFLLRDGWPMSDPFYPGYLIIVTDDTVGATRIIAIGDVSVGDDFDAIPANDTVDAGMGWEVLHTDILNLPETPESPDFQRTFSVRIIGDPDSKLVTSFLAPVANWGA